MLVDQDRIAVRVRVMELAGPEVDSSASLMNSKRFDFSWRWISRVSVKESRGWASSSQPGLKVMMSPSNILWKRPIVWPLFLRISQFRARSPQTTSNPCKRRSGACDAPRLNARRFEGMVVEKIRTNILTEGNIRELVKLVDEEMDGVAREQRVMLETVEAELADVRRSPEQLYNLVETTDMDTDDFKPRIRDHRERQERLEATAEEARALLSQRRVVLDDVKTITAYAEDMSEFLNESELTERWAFIESFVKEIVVRPGNAVVRYSIPMPEDSRIPGRVAEEVALHGPVLSTVKYGGPKSLFRRFSDASAGTGRIDGSSLPPQRLDHRLCACTGRSSSR